ncbi:hypothetical protein HME7025_02112 [Aquirufa nivalisilvae]|uniref:Alpha glucuronidase N-terminal domain-containing protein n=1 Tax=Aquirufa nivalisilvae TaxID=2516557 RepID=A0A2S2DY37_9BACT|nr:hypothetical protein [Aquirufa nivalisilvae]AWL09960.1 hypothetical protein HME7025_02112 [Aquirufa nivalisilvae]
MKIIHFRNLLFAFVLFLHHGLLSQVVDFSKASIAASSAIASPFKEKMIAVLQEEIANKTNLKLSSSPQDKSPLLLLAQQNSQEVNGFTLPTLTKDDQPSIQKEGFRLVHQQIGGRDLLWFIGADQRGLLFAIGEFLRTADLSNQKILFDKKYEKSSAPMYAIRGHQIGYRNTANSWDAWDFKQFERYFRDLAFFGTNAIENIPFQDGAASPHMKINREEMHIKMSQMCQAYDLDYWVWTPADVDLADPQKFQEELKAHIEFYKNCPRLDGVFFPGGDPGENHPKYVLPFLKAVAAELKKYHPKAGVWLSLQGFNDEEVNYFYDYLDQNKPDWFTGIVTGPSSPDLASTRFRLDKKYQHRHYPDLTHTVRCQYPTENWDQAFALTEGREVTNPQPSYYAKIHNRFAPFTDGFLSYSDGVHDDVNKVIWSQMAWNTEKDVRQVMVEYARYFFGNSVAEAAADGILALERNWVGPVEENGGIETSFAFWQNLEKNHPELKGNWRWQQLVMRAYYDTFIKRRKMYEQGLEKEANLILSQAKVLGSEKAMSLALEKVNQAVQRPAAPELRQKVVDYCEALYQSIGLQTSVAKYKASGAERGAILDFIDYPLNNRWWLEDEFAKIRKMADEAAKLERINIIATWENPGPGSYYDNISDQLKGPRVKTKTEDATDVAWWDNGLSRRRLSTQLFQNFPKLEYEDLDPKGSYTIRISGQGDALLRVDGVRVRPVIYNKGVEEFKEFQLNPKFISDGKISISFDEPEESHLNWRQHSKVFDIWLLKK